MPSSIATTTASKEKATLPVSHPRTSSQVRVLAPPHPEPNPSYHLSADTAVNFDYAADIARAVIAAARVAATQ